MRAVFTATPMRHLSLFYRPRRSMVRAVSSSVGTCTHHILLWQSDRPATQGTCAIPVPAVPPIRQGGPALIGALVTCHR